MKHALLLATGIIAALSFTSCKKDSSGPDGGGNPDTEKQLKKVTRTEDGQVTVYNFTYDDQKRLTSYKSTDDAESVIFTYNGQNLVGIEQKEDNSFKNVYAFTYQDNKPVSGTLKAWQLTAGEPNALIEEDKLTYTVTNNQVSAIKLEILGDNMVMDFALSYANGNLKSISTETPYAYSANFSFGNHKPIFPKVTNWILDQAGFSMQFAAQNELLTADYDFPRLRKRHQHTYNVHIR
jgi:hypothetical protein